MHFIKSSWYPLRLYFPLIYLYWITIINFLGLHQPFDSMIVCLIIIFYFVAGLWDSFVNNILNVYKADRLKFYFVLSFSDFCYQNFGSLEEYIMQTSTFPIFMFMGIFCSRECLWWISIKSSGFGTIWVINLKILTNYFVQLFHYFLKHFGSFYNLFHWDFHWHKTEHSQMLFLERT